MWHVEKARSCPDTGNLAPSEGLGRENHAAHFLRFSTCFGIGIVGCLRGPARTCVARSVVDYVTELCKGAVVFAPGTTRSVAIGIAN